MPNQAMPNQAPGDTAPAANGTAATIPSPLPEPDGALVRKAQAGGIIVLATLAVIYSLAPGRDLLLPVVLAAVLNLLFEPLMRALNTTLRLPMPIAALIIIALVFALIVGIAYAVSLPSANWIDRVPEKLAMLKEKLAFLARPIAYAQELLRSIENMGAGAGKPGEPVAVAQGSALPGIILLGTAASVREFLTTMLVLYFMLATGDRLLRGVIEVLPTFRDKRRAVEIAGEIQSGIGSYLLTITAMNAAVGIVTALAMWACGLEDPLLWGACAFLLNFLPILGPLIGIALFFAAGLFALPWPFPALAPALLYTTIHLIEGQAVTPMLVARRFELNPVLIILSLLFWHAVWGMPGALLAVPLLAIIKIFCDKLDPLKSIGHLIGS